jgi:hypothetical protein
MMNFTCFVTFRGTNKRMKRCHMIAFEFLSTQQTKANHAEIASEVITILRLLYHCITVRTHLYSLAFGCYLVLLFQMIFTRYILMPLLFSQRAKFKIAVVALNAIVISINH